MVDREKAINLYELYKELLTDREKEYFENYFFEDYSLQEIADNYEVSKSYVSKFINIICDKLEGYEDSLRLLYKNNMIKYIIKDLDVEIRNKIESLL